VHVDEKVYTYSYGITPSALAASRKTITDILNNTAEGVTGSKAPIVNGVSHSGDIPGYSKENAYRVYATCSPCPRTTRSTISKGQVREGVWWEGQYTHRFRRDFDMTLCNEQGIKSLRRANRRLLLDSSLFKAKKAVLTRKAMPNSNERSGWSQIQPYMEVDIHPVENLTLTPGVKICPLGSLHRRLGRTQAPHPVRWFIHHRKDAGVLRGELQAHAVVERLRPVRRCIYVPDISAFEQSTPVLQYPAAETHHQLSARHGFYADRYTFDADVYYIPVKNNYISENCSLTGGPSGETCFINTGTRNLQRYRAEGTYDLGMLFGGPWRGLQGFLNGSVMSSMSNGLWLIARAPLHDCRRRHVQDCAMEVLGAR